MTATYAPYRLDLERNARDLESRVHTLELGATALEQSIERRCAQLKGEIEMQIWLKGLLALSWGMAIVAWVVAIASWLR